MSRFQHKFKKQFGQNFLRSSKYAREMVKILAITERDIVVEIGPGDGLLTQELLESPAKLVIAIEIDYQLIPGLVKRFNESAKFELVHRDILAVNWQSITAEFSSESNSQLWQTFISGKSDYRLKITGSLPYNISKQIINQALQNWPTAHQMCFIVQEEVAQDYVAASPKGTFLANYTKLYANVKKHHTIPASQFYPQPKVGGGILEITPRILEPAARQRREAWAKILRLAFAAPRKTIKNNLIHVSTENSQSPQIAPIVQKLIETYGSKRAAELDWQKIFTSEM